MFALRSIIIIVVSSTISNVHSGRILLGKEAPSRMNGRLGDSDMNSFVRSETSQGSNLLENQIYANVDYSNIKLLPNSEKPTLGRKPSQELNDNEPIYSQEKSKLSRSKHISGNHRQIFKTRDPFHFNKHLQIVSHFDNVSHANGLSTKSLRDPKTNRTWRGSTIISKIQSLGSPTYFKNRRPISAAKTNSFKQHHNDRIITASSATRNIFNNGFGQNVGGNFHSSIYPPLVAVAYAIETTTPARAGLISGPQIICISESTFNGYNECRCVGDEYIITKSNQCIPKNGRNIPRLRQ